ncbi:MAG: ATP-dependent helicase [Thermoleophilia bacterium]
MITQGVDTITQGVDTRTPALDSFLCDLNEQQRTAVLHGDDPLLIIAGAGTGKTTTLANRVAYQIAGGINPARILLLTFTRRAAAEMLRRGDGALRRAAVAGDTAVADGNTAAAGDTAVADGQNVNATPIFNLAGHAGARVWGGTFHSTAARLLRLHGRDIGLEPGFTILDRADSEDVMGTVRAKSGLARLDRRFPQKATCLDIYSHCVNTRRPLEQALRVTFPWCLEHAEDLSLLFSAYVDHKAESSVLDYDDLLVFWRGLLTDPATGAAVRARFDRVLVDEYQDTNALQAEILALLRPGGRGLTVVGDDAQSIYAFRGATVRNILDFPKQFLGASTVTLDQNYRSTQLILEVTNRVIANAEERYEKHLWSRRDGGERPRLITCGDEDEQTEFLVKRILDHREQGIALRKQAVLFRASHHSLPLELELGRRNIPYHKYGGLKFMETAHVKDLVAFLRLAENPRDETAGMRVLQLLPGVGPRRAASLLARLRDPGQQGGTQPAAQPGTQCGAQPATQHGAQPDERHGGRPGEGGPFAAWEDACPSEAAARHWHGLVQLLADLSVSHPGPPSVQVERVESFYAPLLERLYESPESRLRDIQQIARLADRATDRAHFLADLALDPPSWTGDLAGPPVLDEDYLILSTMHSAKGLEWEAVYVIHAADGNIPSDMATGSAEEIEEERRLFYVALTRARDWLYVCCPFRYHTVPRRPSDAYGYAQISRFLSPNVREAMLSEAAEWYVEDSEADGACRKGGDFSQGAVAGPPITVADIRAGVKRLW